MCDQVIYVSQGANLNIASCTFMHNAASGAGAVVFAASANTILIERSQFFNNQALAGSVFTSEVYNVTVSSCEFSRNRVVADSAINLTSLIRSDLRNEAAALEVCAPLSLPFI